MLYSKKYQNKKIAVYGMGATGFSAVKAFKSLKAKVYCWDDSKKVRRKARNYNHHLCKFWLNKYSVDNIIISPGINIDKCKIKKYLKKNLDKLITDLDVFFEFNKKALLIAITGTNGKSTTCKILEKILRTAKHNVETVGNIGNPILYSKKPSKRKIFILEASSYQLQYSKLLNSNHAAILNISPDHLERHKNIENYIKIKSKIFLGQKTKDYSYINLNNKYTKYIKKIFKIKKIKSKLIIVNKFKYNFLLNKINNRYLKNSVNIENLAFACEIAKNLKINEKIIIRALNNFKGLPHRQEVIFSNKKLLCINDSKDTTFDATAHALKNYDKIFWILGGLPKKEDNFYLKNVKKNILKAYIIGKNASFFRKKIKNYVQFKISNNMKKAITDINRDLKSRKNSKSTILLSPAAASFDQFENFEKRGAYFKKLIIKKFSNTLNV